MRSQDIAIVGILLACAAIARLAANVIPTPIVSNLAIGFYCLAIILTAPRISEALGIGLIAGIICAMISHSIYPPANLISEPVGVLVCLAVYGLLAKKTKFAAGTATFLATCASGFTFVLVALVMASSAIALRFDGMLPFFIAMSPIVIGTAIANSIVIGLLALPAIRVVHGSRNSSSGNDSTFKRDDPVFTEGSYDSTPVVLENVHYRYPGTDKPALSNVSLHAEKGDFILITGPTASGKTTLCNTIAGITHHEHEGEKKGSVRLFGRDIMEYNGLAAISAHVCIVFDDPDSQLIFTSVEEEISSSLFASGFNPEEIESRIVSLLSSLSLLDLRDRPVSALSGGQKQRVSIAAALAMDRPVLILDEPTGELDATATRCLVSLLRKLADKGCTVIVADHTPEVYADAVTKVLVMDRGVIVREGDADLARELATIPCTYTTSPYVPASSDEQVISISNLTHAYGPIIALNSVSLSVAAGEFIAIIGDNGSGKTTLIRHLNGLLYPASGSVIVNGIDTSQSTITELVKTSGLLFQNPDTMLFAESVYDEVAFGAVNTREAADEKTDQRIKNAIYALGLSGKEDVYPRSLSRGERQRLAIACILAMETKVLILDEPTTGLDEAESELVMQRLREYQNRGYTIVMVTHNQQMAYRHSNRVIAMDHGVIVNDAIVTREVA
ncbi:MAG: ATP-binding cassette domain-containing protein [Euryarchaeota archaeon]|nr:ATP-binding cassette domain-containing protein [Euryarchaeota archaeon]